MNRLFLKIAHLKNTYDFSRSTLSLPIYPELNKKDVYYIIKCINKFYENK